MRLDPISKPKPLIIKLAYLFSKRMFGKVLSPLLVIYARSVPIFKVATKILSADKKLSLDRKINLLIRNFVSNLNDCKFCSNAIEHLSKKEKFETQKIKELMNFRSSATFSAKEKAVLNYVEQISATKTATQEAFNELKHFFNDKEIVEITWVCASENYFNMQAKPLGFTSDQLIH
jgi:alkylhydroperoxidase family enzyme